MNRTFEVVAKSFINTIGPNIGFFTGMTLVPTPIIVPSAPPLLVPVSRQDLLRAMAFQLDSTMRENPTTTAKDKVYRLFSRCLLTVEFEGGRVTAATSSPLDTDTGLEGPLQAPPLSATPVSVAVTPAGAAEFSWSGKGRPHPLVEPGFILIMPRSSVFIWHEVRGTIAFVGGRPVVTVSLRGSRFPSHRAFVDGVSVADLRQNNLSDLWTPDGKDPTKVA